MLKKIGALGRVKWGFLISPYWNQRWRTRHYSRINSPVLFVPQILLHCMLAAFLLYREASLHFWQFVGFFFRPLPLWRRWRGSRKIKWIIIKTVPRDLRRKLVVVEKGWNCLFFLLSDRWNTLWTTNLVLIPASPLKNGQVNKIIDNRTHGKGFAQAEKR